MNPTNAPTPRPDDLVSRLEPSPPAPADDQESVYYQGHPLLRGEPGTVVGWGLAGLVLVAIPIGAALLDYSLPWWLNIGLVLAAVGVTAVPLLLVRRTFYRITNYRIDIESGLLSKNIDTLELWHVDDIRFHQSLFDRMLGVGTITVVSGDSTTPNLQLRSLPKPRPLFEQLKQRVIAVKRQRGVIKMDMGHAPDVSGER